MSQWVAYVWLRLRHVVTLLHWVYYSAWCVQTTGLNWWYVFFIHITSMNQKSFVSLYFCKHNCCGDIWKNVLLCKTRYVQTLSSHAAAWANWANDARWRRSLWKHMELPQQAHNIDPILVHRLQRVKLLWPCDPLYPTCFFHTFQRGNVHRDDDLLFLTTFIETEICLTIKIISNRSYCSFLLICSKQRFQGIHQYLIKMRTLLSSLWNISICRDHRLLSY